MQNNGRSIPERASYEVSLKILENSGNNVREAVDGEVCRGLWQKYMNDVDVASITREALSLPTLQRQDAIFWAARPLSHSFLRQFFNHG